MDRVRRLIEAQAAYRLSLYGEGVGVAVVDSGINDRHPDLKGRVVYSYNYLTKSSDAADDCGHGTHISGIIGGTGEASGGRYQGLAPRCHFVSLKILDSRGNGDSVSLIRALYWLMEHGKEYDVRIINMSVGGRVPQERMRTELIQAVEEDVYKRQLYDWDMEVNTTDPKFYKWTQWIFVQMFKKGLAYEKEFPINWCPSCKTGLANEEVCLLYTSASTS